MNYSERLPFWTCFFLNSESYTLRKNIEVENVNSSNITYNFQCEAPGKYLTGSDDVGRAICILLAALICLVGFLGIVTNILNIVILKKSFPGRGPFKEALMLLSIVELILSLATVGFTSFTISILENWDRSEISRSLLLAFRVIHTLTRTISVYVTILITFERFIVIAFPNKSKQYLHDQFKAPRIALAVVITFCVIINIPVLTKYKVVQNEYSVAEEYNSGNKTNGMEFMDHPFITTRAGFLNNIPRILKDSLMAIDYFIPLPVLLIFNCLLYLKLFLWNKARAALTGRQKRDIKTAKMFSVVVLVILIGHTVSCVVYVVIRAKKAIYRELLLLQNLGVVLGTSANFLVYYWFGYSFQREFWAQMRTLLGEGCQSVVRKHQQCSMKKPSSSMSSVQ